MYTAAEVIHIEYSSSYSVPSKQSVEHPGHMAKHCTYPIGHPYMPRFAKSRMPLIAHTVLQIA